MEKDLKYQKKLYPTIKSRNIAIMLIDFPDTPKKYKKLYPSINEAKEYFLGEKLSAYFHDMSYGKFKLDGDVFGYYTMPQNLTKTRCNNEYIIKTTENFDIRIDDFKKEKYDTIAFIIFHHKYEQGGLSAANFANYTINGVKYTKQNVLYVGVTINAKENSYLKEHKYFIRYGNSEDEVETGKHEINFLYNQSIFAHEYIHLLTGVRNIPHSNTSTNNGFADYEELNKEQPSNFLDLEYGNRFDLMGSGALSFSMNSGYRKLLGWCDDTNTISFYKKGRNRVKIYPINSSKGIRIIEIRLLNKKLQNNNKDYPGYFLELRRPDRWDRTLSNRHLVENTKGIFVLKTDGYKTMLLDMNKSKNFVDEKTGKHFVDYRNMALKVGMKYSNKDVVFENVVKNDDDSFSLDITLK